MSEPYLLFWHRRDLRLSDNVGLFQISQQSQRVVGVFCLDPHLLNSKNTAPKRIAYMLGCLRELQINYAAVGSQLLILYDEPSQGIPKLATALSATAVYWNLDVEPYARERDERVTIQLQQQGVEVRTFWDHLLHSPEEILTGTKHPYKVYTPFWKNWSRHEKTTPYPAPKFLQGLSPAESEQAHQAGAIPLPSERDLGINGEFPLIVEPGEQAAREQLDDFCDRAIYNYQEQRNFPSINGTSRLSAALKFGAIGIRSVWQATETVLETCRGDEDTASATTWQKELAWREFYQHAMYHFPELADGPYRSPWQNFPWREDTEHFQAWCEGKTGYPIVDAAMRELNTTGWMHNRCRMIVASFLTKDLRLNWQWGEQYFMQKLIDGDLSANNGGWQWSSSSGMDPKPLRIFNPNTQAQKFDPEGEYIRYWLPELRSLDTEQLVTGKIPPLDLQACDYPAPIVNHQEQQKMFKNIYKQLKETVPS